MILKINQQNKKEIEVFCDSSRELSIIKTHLSPQMRNHRFKKVKHGKWNGKVEFMRKDRFVPIQLWQTLYKLSMRYNLKFEYSSIKPHLVDEVDEKIVEEIYRKAISCDDEIKFDEDQLESIIKLLKHKYAKANLSVSYGKTLVFFVVTYYLRKYKGDKILLITPKPTLNTQMYGDFVKYSRAFPEFVFEFTTTNMLRSFSDSKNYGVIIGNFQYLWDKEQELFEEYTVSLIDEVHRASSKSYKIILDKCNNLRSTKGASGTLYTDHTVETMATVVASGHTIKTVKKREIINSNRATNGKIVAIRLNTATASDSWNLSDFYLSNKEPLERLGKEKMIVWKSLQRIQFISKLAVESLETHGNGLIFFKDVKHGYGKKIFDHISSIKQGVKVFYIDEKTKPADRTQIYDYVKVNNGCIIIVSYDIGSTGLSINTLGFGIMAEPTKSVTSIGQVIGRFMRLHEDKSGFVLYDIIDDIKLRDGKQCYYMNWFTYNRMPIYKVDGFVVEERTEILNTSIW